MNMLKWAEARFFPGNKDKGQYKHENKTEVAQLQKDNMAVKSYITICDSFPKTDFDIDDFLQGNQDEGLIELFPQECDVYENLTDLQTWTAGLKTRHRSEHGIYVLESPYSKDQLKIIAEQGHLSQAISCAYSYSLLRRSKEWINSHPGYQKIDNLRFNRNLIPSNTSSTANSPSATA